MESLFFFFFMLTYDLSPGLAIDIIKAPSLSHGTAMYTCNTDCYYYRLEIAIESRSGSIALATAERGRSIVPAGIRSCGTIIRSFAIMHARASATRFEFRTRLNVNPTTSLNSSFRPWPRRIESREIALVIFDARKLALSRKIDAS